MSAEEQFDLTDAELRAADERFRARAAQRGPRTAADHVAPSDVLATLEALGRRAGEERQALPCFAAAEAGDLGTAARVCEAAQAFQHCRWAQDESWCSRVRRGAEARAAADRLRDGKVPERFAQSVLAGLPGRHAVGARELLPTEALRLVRAFISGRPQGVPLDDGGSIAFIGNEWVLVLAGLPGNGKSVASAYGVAMSGGLWMHARTLAKPRVELDDAERAPLLVIDDLGTEHAGESGYGISRAQALLEHRHAERRRTIITTNLRRRRASENDPVAFVDRYGDRVNDRLSEGGKYIVLTAPSLRGKAP
jgi:hypothetical protein